MRVAIVGGGIAGLTVANDLARHCDVTLFEKESRLGGHSNTASVTLGDTTYEVDTGFIVFNERNYPTFCSLLDEWGVASQPSEMSFSVSDQKSGLEYAGTGLSGLFAQRRNVLSPSFWRLLREILRFGRLGQRELARSDRSPQSVGEFLAAHHFSNDFVAQYLIPLGSAIWSANPTTFDRFPVGALLYFLDNHGLLSFRNRPAWRTIVGGSQSYVEAARAHVGDGVRVLGGALRVTRDDAGAMVTYASGEERFDQVVLACHSDQALELLSDASPEETSVLGALRYQENVAVLHTDETMMPRSRRAYAAWNYFCPRDPSAFPTVTYWMNALQRLSSPLPLLVSLNRQAEIHPDHVLGTYTYHHPVYDEQAFMAQERWSLINGVRSTWFCGAYWGYGFHEDGARSGRRVAQALLAKSGQS